ncbi:type III polyketide synthase [Plantibacter sp. YIM 135347]|uniref:type III polyketide synthase n=1 Tax=Plantibacter sp. YIM 135347 TaxID=3423919 RepID=UPI003D33F105
MSVTVRSIGTAVPNTVLHQSEVKSVFSAQPGLSRLGTRIIGAAFDASAITTRHTVIDELSFSNPTEDPVFYDAANGLILQPPTGVRNDAYAKHSPELFLGAARRALEGADGIDASDVTHVITASCTGFFAPGPDYVLVRELGLSPSTQRYHLGFMGCYAAFPALRAAATFCIADPDAVVLVVCVELCSLHLRSSNDPDTIVASSVFADGAAAAVVTARPAPAGSTVLDLDAFETVVVPDGEADMAWTIGDHGFEMVLSSYVPQIIEHNIEQALAPLLARSPGLADAPYRAIERWAIHPGGRSILDKVQHTLDLDDAQLEPSRAVLAEYGNMSSATVLFVLERILKGPAPELPERVCSMAFGPGLTVETALLTARTVAVDGASRSTARPTMSVPAGASA